MRWLQTPWGRIALGLVLAQGLFYGLTQGVLAVRQLVPAGEEATPRALATGTAVGHLASPAGQPWNTLGAVAAAEPRVKPNFRDVLLFQGAQALGLLLGALLAGAGQRHGLVLGAVVGVWNGVLAALWKQNAAHELTFVSVYAGPLLHAAVGALGGWLGSAIWSPLDPAAPAVVVRARKPPRPRGPLFAGPVAWVRVLLGIALAVAGSLSAEFVLEAVEDFSRGKLGTTGDFENWLITWEIKALAVLVGGALAGASTSNGQKQGLLVGLGSAMILVAVPPAQNVFAVPGFTSFSLAKNWVVFAGLTLVSSVCLALVGGWFAGRLFPPVVKRSRVGGLTREEVS
jgi:hypothetical protein